MRFCFNVGNIYQPHLFDLYDIFDTNIYYFSFLFNAMYKLPTPLFAPIVLSPALRHLLDFWQTELEKLDSESIIQWTFDTFGMSIAFAPSWSEEDDVLGSMLGKSLELIPVVDYIHDLLLPETWTPLKQHEMTQSTFDGRAASAELWARFQVELLCKKHERTIGRYQTWLVSTRREQNSVFEKMPILSWSERFGVFRIAPLAHWSSDRICQSVATSSVSLSRKKNPVRITSPEVYLGDDDLSEIDIPIPIPRELCYR